MSKRKSVQAVRVQSLSPAVVNTAPGITMTNPNQPIPVNMDLRITPESLVKVAYVDRMEDLFQERSNAEANLRLAQEEHSRMSQQLTTQADQVVKTFSMDSTVGTLIKAMTDFTGETYVARLFADNWEKSYYHQKQEQNDTSQPRLDISQLKLLGRLCVFKFDKDDDYRNETPVLSRKVDLPFSEEMKQTVRSLEVSANQIRHREGILLDIKRRIADLPRLKDRAEANLTKAYLRGELKNGQALLDAVLDTPSKSLPAPRNKE